MRSNVMGIVRKFFRPEFLNRLDEIIIFNNLPKDSMKEILAKIQSGEFADEFLNDCRQSNDGTGGPVMKANRKSNADHSIEVVGNELRSKMKFLQTEKLVDKKKN